MIKLFLIFFFIFYISVIKIYCRNYFTVIGSDRHTNWGDWHNPVFCPGNSFAVGIDIKFERLAYAGDDTHLNAIRLTCHNTASTKIQSREGSFGKWYTEKGGQNKRSIQYSNNTNSSISARFSSLVKFLPDILGLLGQAAQVGVFFTKEQLSNRCGNLGKFVGFNFVAEPPISGDDTAGNMVSMCCIKE